MPSPKNPDDRSVHIPEPLIETINKLVRTSRQMLTEIGREPTPEELAAMLEMPLEKVRKLLITRAGFTVRRAGLASISTPGQQASTRRHRGALDKSESG